MICPPAKITPALTFAGHVQVHPPPPPLAEYILNFAASLNLLLSSAVGPRTSSPGPFFSPPLSLAPPFAAAAEMSTAAAAAAADRQMKNETLSVVSQRANDACGDYRLQSAS